MKNLLLLAVLASLLVGGCSTTDRTITDPAGALRPWEPAEIDWDHGAVPVNTSTDTEKHIWTQSPIPTVPPMHDEWRSD
jgi:hypothetical protein